MDAFSQPMNWPALESIIDFSPIVILPETLLVDAIALMGQAHPCPEKQTQGHSHSSCVLVAEHSQLIGIATAHDVVRVIAAQPNFSRVKVAEAMTHPVISLTHSQSHSVLTAWSLLRQHQIRHLPIVNGQGEVMGLVTQNDLLQCFEPPEPPTAAFTQSSIREEQSAKPEPRLQELELLSDQHRLEAFFTQSPDGFFFMMLDRPIRWDEAADREALLDYVFSHQRITKVNAAMLAQYGAAEAEFMDLTPQDFFAHDRKTGRQLWREMFDKGRLHVETSEQKLDGTSMWIEGDYSCLYNSDGDIIGHFGIQRDISKSKRAELDRKRAEEELLESQQALTDFVENAIVCLHWIDSDGTIIWANQAELDLLGYTREEYIGHSITEFHADRTAIEDILQKLLTDQLVQEYETDLRCKDGSIRHVLIDSNSSWRNDKFVRTRCFTRDITDRKRTEDALRQSEQKFRAIFDGTFQFMGVLNHEGIVTEANRTALDAIAVNLEDVVGLPFWATPWWTHSPVLQEQLKQAIARAAQGELVRFEAEHILADGTSVFVDFTLKPVFDESGKVIMLIPEGRDVSDRKQAETQLRQQEAFLKSIYNGTEQAIFVVDITAAGELRYAGFNPVSERYAGVTHAQIQGKTPEEAFGEAFGSTLRQNYERCLQAGTSITYEELLEFESHRIWTLTTLVPLRDEQDRIYRIIGTATDISDRKRTEEALRESEQRLQSMLDYSTALIYMKDPQGRYMMINRSYEILFHLNRNEVKGKTDQDIFPKEIADAFQANDREAIAAGVALEKEEVAPHDDGPHTYLSIKFPLFDAGGAIYAVCGMSTDISDRKQAEVSLQNQKQDLARSNGELQQFAYVASHDLQEPLRMITSYLELLERRYKGRLDAKADKFIAYAVDGATRMQTLINDLLSYSRVGTQEKGWESVACEKIVQNVLIDLQVTIAQSNAVITYAPLPQVNADPSQLTQLFQNLLSNAIKFRREEPLHIHIEVKRTNDKWLFSVRDNGMGIDTQYMDRIFIIFQRLHSRTEYPGTGIGLAVCKKIVERHEGRLWVESQLGQGSTFFFTLPDLVGTSS
jgi:PAS domain S-box-containing protein